MSLVTISDVKTFMQITGTASDALLEVYISLTEAEIAAYLDRNLESTTYTETPEYLQSQFDRTGQTYLDASEGLPKLFLDNYPVTSIIGITSGDTTLTSSQYSYESENGVLSPTFQLSEPTVTYVAGYTTATFPTALKSVVYMGVSSLYYNNSASAQAVGNVKSKKIKDFSVDYGNAQTGYISQNVGPQGLQIAKTHIAANAVILDRYRRITI